jgi:hypothetical protein
LKFSRAGDNFRTSSTQNHAGTRGADCQDRALRWERPGKEPVRELRARGRQHQQPAIQTCKFRSVYGENFKVKFHSNSCAFYCLPNNNGLINALSFGEQPTIQTEVNLDQSIVKTSELCFIAIHVHSIVYLTIVAKLFIVKR